jgi:hypothetical protein
VLFRSIPLIIYIYPKIATHTRVDHVPQDNKYKGLNSSSQLRLGGMSVPSVYAYIVIGLFVLVVLAGGVLAASFLLPKVMPCAGGTPVCGADGNTYNSSCLAQKAGVGVNSDGPCVIACIDSDGGRDIFVAGSASKGGAATSDSCSDRGNVIEAYCSDNQVTTTTYPCPAGYECSAGACVKSNCVDSDGGQDKNVKGSVVYGSTNSTDSCVSSSVVKEYYCQDGALTSADLACDAGSSCVDGACVVDPCKDSDNGINTSVAGAVTKGAGTFSDRCDGTSVVEYYCENGDVKNQTIQCASGSACIQGRCVENTCIDSDGGMDQFTQGNVTLGQTFYQDSCYSDSSVLEYYCASNKSIGNAVISCGTGNECADGKCKAADCVSNIVNLDTTDEEMIIDTLGSADALTLEQNEVVRINNGYLLELYSISGNKSYFHLYDNVSAYRDNDYLCSMVLVAGNSTTTMCSNRINRLKVQSVADDGSTSTLQISGYYVTEYFSQNGRITNWTDNSVCPTNVVSYNSFVTDFFPSIDTDSSQFNLAGKEFRLFDENATLRQVTASSIRFVADGTSYTLSDGDTFRYKNKNYLISLTFMDFGLKEIAIQNN